MILALHGGQPVSTRPWPRWPRAGETARHLIDRVLASDRWSISGPWSGEETLDQRASKAFAEFCGVEYAFAVDHGSSALVAAFLALGIGAGDEVIIPGLTWAACASTVMRVNAVPVPVDISPRTLCIDPDAVERAITARTRAILVVHLYGSMADLDALAALARRNGLILIEDSAQAHGAEWDGVRAGATGAIGTFSFHQGKPMAAGEGGMVVTSDSRLARKLEQIRCDGRRYAPIRRGHQHLAAAADVQGFNFCMAETGTALLLDALERIDHENAHRLDNARRLDERLARTGVWSPVAAYAKNQRRTYYHYAVCLNPGAFSGAPIEYVCEALEAELGAPVTPPYPPMDEFDLVNPKAYPAWRESEWTERTVRSRWDIPCARHASRATVLLHHSLLLCEPDRVAEIAEAFEKVALHAADLCRMPASASA
jgi:dTDP-4-amino-4,6-dideoxygalactose transaminase